MARHLSLRLRSSVSFTDQTEPIHRCAPVRVDEVWDFSWHNIESCMRNPPVMRCHQTSTRMRMPQSCRSNDGTMCRCRTANDSLSRGPSWQRVAEPACLRVAPCGVPLRYVPLGSLRADPLTDHQSDQAQSLTFMGSVQYRASSCLEEVRDQLRHIGAELHLVVNVWTDQELAGLLRSHSIFANLHTHK